jgi:hypothetical protein
MVSPATVPHGTPTVYPGTVLGWRSGIVVVVVVGAMEVVGAAVEVVNGIVVANAVVVVSAETTSAPFRVKK